MAPFIAELAQMGGLVVVKKCDVQDSRQVEALLKDVKSRMPPIKGVIHAPWVPMVCTAYSIMLHITDLAQYEIFERLALDKYLSAVRPKVEGAWNLHQHTLSCDLDFFVMMSSVHGIFGNRGQSSTAAAHTFLDAFMEYRLGQNLPAVTIDLPIIKEVGYMAENINTLDMVAGIVWDSIDQAEFLALMDLAIRGRSSSQRKLQRHDHHIMTGLTVPLGEALPFWMDDARFCHINQKNTPTSSASATDTSDASPVSDPRTDLQAMETVQGAIAYIANAILHRVSKLVMIPVDELNPASPLADYGLDSISGIEIRNWITKDLGAMLTLQDILAMPNVVKLGERVAEISRHVPKLR